MVKDGEEMRKAITCSLSKSLSTSLCELETEELKRMPPLMKNRRYLSKQLSMCKTYRDIAWERRRRQIRGKNGLTDSGGSRNFFEGPPRNHIHPPLLTDEDLHELRGCIELGFGFNEEDGQKLCNTLPALDLYFAVNRQLSPSPPVSTPQSRRSSSESSLGGGSSSFDTTPVSEPADWKVYSPGENPKQVKTKLRHWAQAVACSLMQSYQ